MLTSGDDTRIDVSIASSSSSWWFLCKLDATFVDVGVVVKAAVGAAKFDLLGESKTVTALIFWLKRLNNVVPGEMLCGGKVSGRTRTAGGSDCSHIHRKRSHFGHNSFSNYFWRCGVVVRKLGKLGVDSKVRVFITCACFVDAYKI